MNLVQRRNAALTVLTFCLVMVLFVSAAYAQETTGGIQGIVKDPSGAVVPNATVTVTGSSLLGSKTATTDSGGYYRFANLPPGDYTVSVSASGFKSAKQSAIKIFTGSLPSIDIQMQLGEATQTVEVTGEAPIVDVSQSKVQTNVTQDILENVPHGRSFQSVIQFAPGARNEPLQGGYQIDGASNSENSYLVEGQETGSIQTGSSNTNVPMEFIQEVQIKSSGFEAEYGGALGGVINVIQKRGSNSWHGEVFTKYQADNFDAAPNRTLRLDPTASLPSPNPLRLDAPTQYYLPKKDHYRIVEPGFEAGGYLLKDRLWLFSSFAPTLDRLSRTIRFTDPAIGNRKFNRAIDTYYALGRVDLLAFQKVRVFGAWQYGYQAAQGSSLPGADDVFGARNLSAGDKPDNYNSGIGYKAPNSLYNLGADITLTPSLVATSRFGYNYTDYQDRGLPTGIRYYYRDTTYPYGTTLAPATSGTSSICQVASCGGAGQTLGNATNCPTATPCRTQFIQSSGYSTLGVNFKSLFDKYSRRSFTQDLAYYKRGFMGTHNFKVGYALNRLYNNVQQAFDTSQVYVGFGREYFPTLTSPATGGGRTAPGEHCADVIAENQALYGLTAAQATNFGCRGAWGTVNVRDGNNVIGKVSSLNHAIYAQDAWTIGHGLTLNLGVRADKESLPSYSAGLPGIDFGFTDKVAPRLGASWDALGNGKLKIYGSYGWFFDIMKFEMPRGSFGGNWWHDCVYTLDSPDFAIGFVPAKDSNAHFCPGSGPANGTMTGGRYITNEDFRVPSNDPNSAIDPVSGNPRSGIDPHLQPMKQHELVFGADWAITPTLALETRYSRKRLDRTIEDVGVLTPFGEQYYIANPGYGDHAISCAACPPNPPASRRFDGIETRLTKRPTNGNWFGQLSYTYSRLYGNYSGLTATDISDGGGARNSPNVDRAFDEPFMSFNAHGKVIDGPLATDRPNAFKAIGYYRLKWWKMETLLGAYQQWYSGTPLSSYISVWGAPVFLEGRGKFVDITRDPATGNWVAGAIKDRRTPTFSQTDLQFTHEMHVSSTNERLKLGLDVNITNLFNQRSVTLINSNPIRSGSINPRNAGGSLDYVQLETGAYDYLAVTNGAKKIFSNQYGLPYGFQGGRALRFKLKYTF